MGKEVLARIFRPRDWVEENGTITQKTGTGGRRFDLAAVRCYTLFQFQVEVEGE